MRKMFMKKKHGSHPTFGQEEADSHHKHENVSAEESCNDDDDDDPDYFEGSTKKSEDLKDPELTTRGEKNFVCDQCKQRFKVKQIMLKHRLKKHGSGARACKNVCVSRNRPSQNIFMFFVKHHENVAPF